VCSPVPAALRLQHVANSPCVSDAFSSRSACRSRLEIRGGVPPGAAAGSGPAFPSAVGTWGTDDHPFRPGNSVQTARFPGSHSPRDVIRRGRGFTAGPSPREPRRSFSCDTDAACEGFLGSQQERLPQSAPPAAGRRRPGERPSAPRGRSAPSATRSAGRACGGVPAPQPASRQRLQRHRQQAGGVGAVGVIPGPLAGGLYLAATELRGLTGRHRTTLPRSGVFPSILWPPGGAGAGRGAGGCQDSCQDSLALIPPDLYISTGRAENPARPGGNRLSPTRKGLNAGR
jgi:hypothetical protein